MAKVVYFIGAGLTKSLEKPDWPVPTMWDFTRTAAHYVVSDDVLLTTMAELELAGVYQHASEEAADLASQLVGKCADRSVENKKAFQDALEARIPESIESLLESAFRVQASSVGHHLPQRFIYAINQLFS